MKSQSNIIGLVLCIALLGCGTGSGTFTGTISNATFTDQVSINVTQNGTFGITASGTSTEPGFVTSIAITPSGTATDNLGGYSNVIGATITPYGQETNLSVGTRQLLVIGHSNSTGTQVLVSVTGAAGTETGTLTKQ